jgi:hypothetical protein
MYDSYTALAVLAHERAVRRAAARPERLMLHELRRTRPPRRLRRRVA